VRYRRWWRSSARRLEPATVARRDEVTSPERVQAQLMAAVASFQTNINLGADGAVTDHGADKEGEADSRCTSPTQAERRAREMKKIMRRAHPETIEQFHGCARWRPPATSAGSPRSYVRRGWPRVPDIASG